MILLESPMGWKDYELLDSGEFEKLERFGDYILIRPEPKALWKRSMSAAEWTKLAHTRFTTGAGFGKAGKEDSGTWHKLKRMDEQWPVEYKKGSMRFSMRMGLTSFKHVGIFPEQAPNWDFIYDEVKRVKTATGTAPKVLNLFAYTGAASLAARCAGADVTHLDSVRQVVTWARGNMEMSGLENIRWVIEDALKFVKREAKRGNLYQGVIMDPPAYGHGPDGEKWKLDELLYEFLAEVNSIVDKKRSFVVLNLYSNGYSAVLAETLMNTSFGLKKGDNGKSYNLSFGELMLKDKFEKSLPLSVFVRLSR